MLITTLLRDVWRLLSFRRPGPAIQQQWPAFLAFGLCCTWLAGMGRYWDNPRAEWWQLLGLGSLAYVFTLSLLLWAILAPLRPRHWHYRNVLLFVTLTAPPALLYAIPVERFVAPDIARAANAWFLAAVASWRVGLLAVFLTRVAGLSPVTAAVGTLLPLALIVITLSMLNLEHVVFDLMSGIRAEDRSPHDSAYEVVLMLSMLSFIASPILLIAYGMLAWQAWRRD